MTEAEAVHIHCPDCGLAIPITLQTKGMTSQAGVLQLVLEPDLTDAWAHTWTHEM
ncbi:hypothetical protein [Streptomyces hydrogenans]|uniref:hypothetical protein n=1 Tax=Streptomyces hydrogenans TaxID=1873719 RepID=UPI003827A2DF